MRRILIGSVLIAVAAFSVACAGESSREAANSTGTTTYNGSNSSSAGSSENLNSQPRATPASVATPGQPGIKPPTSKNN